MQTLSLLFVSSGGQEPWCQRDAVAGSGDRGSGLLASDKARGVAANDDGPGGELCTASTTAAGDGSTGPICGWPARETAHDLPIRGCGGRCLRR